MRQLGKFLAVGLGLEPRLATVSTKTVIEKSTEIFFKKWHFFAPRKRPFKSPEETHKNPSKKMRDLCKPL
jgi:hypothetical protein